MCCSRVTDHGLPPPCLADCTWYVPFAQSYPLSAINTLSLVNYNTTGEALDRLNCYRVRCSEAPLYAGTCSVLAE